MSRNAILYAIGALGFLGAAALRFVMGDTVQGYVYTALGVALAFLSVRSLRAGGGR